MLKFLPILLFLFSPIFHLFCFLFYLFCFSIFCGGYISEIILHNKLTTHIIVKDDKNVMIIVLQHNLELNIIFQSTLNFDLGGHIRNNSYSCPVASL